MPQVLVYGIAITGKAVLRALMQRGYDVVAVDDVVTVDKQELADELGVDLINAPSRAVIRDLVRACDFVAPAPGVPEHHEVVIAAMELRKSLRTEIDLAFEWEQARPGGPRPMLGITGTDGKTTTTFMATAILAAAGLKAVAVGNTDVPLVAALDSDAQAFVVECTSFRLSWTECFRPASAVWLNLAPDHLNWHRGMETYTAAKARIWKYQTKNDAAIGFIDDDVVRRYLRAAPARQYTFGRNGSDYFAAAGWLMSPSGRLCEIGSMRRALPHDVTNALAAAALVETAGLADAHAIARALATFEGPAHRIEPVGEADGVTWFNDSKATSPHAALTAIRAFDHLVLIAGGRNKGLDLTSLASEPQRMRAVVAIGECAQEIAAVFDGVCPVRVATSMNEAVDYAADLARQGDAVVLSPACASFDWYPDGGYPARGNDFRAIAQAYLAEVANRQESER